MLDLILKTLKYFHWQTLARFDANNFFSYPCTQSVCLGPVLQWLGSLYHSYTKEGNAVQDHFTLQKSLVIDTLSKRHLTKRDNLSRFVRQTNSFPSHERLGTTRSGKTSQTDHYKKQMQSQRLILLLQCNATLKLRKKG